MSVRARAAVASVIAVATVVALAPAPAGAARARPLSEVVLRTVGNGYGPVPAAFRWPNGTMSLARYEQLLGSGRRWLPVRRGQAFGRGWFREPDHVVGIVALRTSARDAPRVLAAFRRDSLREPEVKEFRGTGIPGALGLSASAGIGSRRVSAVTVSFVRGDTLFFVLVMNVERRVTRAEVIRIAKVQYRRAAPPVRAEEITPVRRTSGSGNLVLLLMLGVGIVAVGIYGAGALAQRRERPGDRPRPLEFATDPLAPSTPEVRHASAEAMHEPVAAPVAAAVHAGTPEEIYEPQPAAAAAAPVRREDGLYVDQFGQTWRTPPVVPGGSDVAASTEYPRR